MLESVHRGKLRIHVPILASQLVRTPSVPQLPMRVRFCLHSQACQPTEDNPERRHGTPGNTSPVEFERCHSQRLAGCLRNPGRFIPPRDTHPNSTEISLECAATLSDEGLYEVRNFTLRRHLVPETDASMTQRWQVTCQNV